MNKMVVYGAIYAVGAGAAAGLKYLRKVERRHRLDLDTWSEEDVVALFARKKMELARKREEMAELMKAMSALQGEDLPRVAKP